MLVVASPPLVGYISLFVPNFGAYVAVLRSFFVFSYGKKSSGGTTCFAMETRDWGARASDCKNLGSDFAV